MFGSWATGGALRRAAVGAIAALGVVAPAGAAAGPQLHTDRGCYLVRQPVHITGSGFAPGREFDVTIDGIDFGQSQTTGFGTFAVTAGPGGLPAGVAQHVEQASASDGEMEASASFTLTRSPGARILATSGSPNSLRAPFEVWGFSLSGARRPVFLHYVAPNRGLRRTVSLGGTGGQCGYLLTGRRRVFPFSPSAGRWRLQIDTSRSYSRSPRGPVATVTVRVT